MEKAHQRADQQISPLVIRKFRHQALVQLDAFKRQVQHTGEIGVSRPEVIQVKVVCGLRFSPPGENDCKLHIPEPKGTGLPTQAIQISGDLVEKSVPPLMSKPLVDGDELLQRKEHDLKCWRPATRRESSAKKLFRFPMPVRLSVSIRLLWKLIKRIRSAMAIIMPLSRIWG